MVIIQKLARHQLCYNFDDCSFIKRQESKSIFQQEILELLLASESILLQTNQLLVFNLLANLSFLNKVFNR